MIAPRFTSDYRRTGVSSPAADASTWRTASRQIPRKTRTPTEGENRLLMAGAADCRRIAAIQELKRLPELTEKAQRRADQSSKPVDCGMIGQSREHVSDPSPGSKVVEFASLNQGTARGIIG
jgi:hypothetical protein